MNFFKIITAVIVLMVSANSIVYSQQDEYAKQILQKVSDKYDAYKTLRSDFTFHAEFANDDSYDDKGIMHFDKDKNSYRIQLQNQTLISDGKTVWSIINDDQEIQITNANQDNETIGPNNIFTFYKSGFKYISLDDEKIESNKLLKVIELSPIDTRKNYFKIKLRINEKNHIHDVKIFDKSGARYTYTISALYVNHTLPNSTFTFNKEQYPKFEIVDLR